MEISINDLNTYQLPSNCFSSHYKILSFLGEGSYGKVFKAREMKTGRIIAVKKIFIGDSQSKYKKTIKEINLLKNLDHPNIVKYYDYFQEEDYVYLMMEFLEGCTLKQYIQKNDNISEDNARIIIKQLLTALSYLHYTCDICHRDVKPENIMFKEKNDINHLKLLDFGLSLDSFESKNHLENCGTLVYMAPELLSLNFKYTKGVDVWSVGIILYMLLMKGKNPFYNKEDKRETIIKNIRNNNVIFQDGNQVSKMGKDLINKLLKKNPLYRYTIRSALEHPWITLKKFDKIPLTIYDKANNDENVERLKLFLLMAIFLNHVKTNNLYCEEIRGKNNLNKWNNISDEMNSESEYKNKKIKTSKQIRDKKQFNMEEYEKKVKNSNRIYHLKFIEDREIMFNPKLSFKTNNKNINDLSSLLKRIKDNQSKEDCSKTLIENSTVKKKKRNINFIQKSSSSKKLFFNDEQKNSDFLEQPNYSKMKTPFKLRNSFLESNRKNFPKTKLKRKFSAMPKIVNNNKEETNSVKNNNQKYKNKNVSTIRNSKNINSNEIRNKKNMPQSKHEKDFNLFSNHLEKKKKLRTNSAKNVNVYFQVDRSMNINNKKMKWHLPFKNENLLNNNFPLLNKGYDIKKKNLEKHIMNVKNILNNNIQNKIILKKDLNTLSITEQTLNSISDYKSNKKKFPVILQ